MLAQSVTGRISTEIDPRLAGDTQAVVARARAIGRLYRQAGVAQDRLLMRIPATWPGIQAMKALEVCMCIAFACCQYERVVWNPTESWVPAFVLAGGGLRHARHLRVQLPPGGRRGAGGGVGAASVDGQDAILVPDAPGGRQGSLRVSAWNKH